MNFSILSIGTELTTGQIINKNSTWIATKLKDSGIESNLHLTVPDDKPLMLDALTFCAKQSDVIFITGGLGPTSDDFTRDVVAEWFDLPLKFDEASWTYIQEFLSHRKVSIKEVQKQQCYFPETAKILKNTKGTANGFSLFKKVNDKIITVFVLPGPPLEIEAIWNDHIAGWLEATTFHVDKVVAYSWDTLGQPESDVASLVTNVLTDMKKDFPLTIGYRAHLPYVEVKVTYPKSIDFTAQIYVKKIEEALAPFTVLRNFEKASNQFGRLILTTDFAFYDFCTSGALHQSLSETLKKQSTWMWKQTPITMDSDFFTDEENFIALWNLNESTCQVMSDFKGKKLLQTIEAPERLLATPGRKHQYFAEMALIEFVKFYS